MVSLPGGAYATPGARPRRRYGSRRRCESVGPCRFPSAGPWMAALPPGTQECYAVAHLWADRWSSGGSISQ
jgi:hypothetical protein